MGDNVQVLAGPPGAGTNAPAARVERRLRMGPFNFPWMTFMAFVVTGASVVGALIWALREGGRGERP
jgi:hypothetical protein